MNDIKCVVLITADIYKHLQDFLRKVNHFRHVQPKALVTGARLNSIQQREGVVARKSSDVKVTNGRNFICQRRELVEVSCKQSARLDFNGDVPFKRSKLIHKLGLKFH